MWMILEKEEIFFFFLRGWFDIYINESLWVSFPVRTKSKLYVKVKVPR